MKHIARIALLIVLALFRRDAARAQPSPASPYGICAHLTRGDEFPIHVESLRMMRDIGIAWARSDFEWSGVQPTPDTWRFDHLDTVIAHAERAGVQMLPILNYSVFFANPAHRHLDLWARYVRALVERYHARLPVWEVWNEQNLEKFWGHPNPDDYLPLLRRTYETIKAINPNLLVAVGGYAGVPLDYIERLYAIGGGNWFDIMNVHPYNHPGEPETHLESSLADLRALMTRFGDANKPIWITEIGWPTQKHRLAAPGLLRAGLRAARPEKSDAWRIAVLDDPAFSRTSAPSDALLADELPPGARVMRLTWDALRERLDPDTLDAVTLPFDESFPADDFDRLLDFVRRGGTLIEFGGMPFFYPMTRNETSDWTPDSRSGHAFRERLRIGIEAWWEKPDLIPQTLPVRFTEAAAVSPQAGNVKPILAERFLKPHRLQGGDRFIPLLAGEQHGYAGTAAAVFNYDSDLAGAVVVSALFERGQRGSTLTQQARFLARAYLISLRLGVERIFWYEFQSPEVDDLDQESHFGITHRDLTPKPAFHAYRTLTSHRPAGSVCLDRAWKSADGALYYPQWTRPDGRVAGAIWAFRKPGRYRLTFSEPAIALVGYAGEPIEASWNGRDCLVVLTDTPIYFVGATLETLAPAPAP